jgi:hypothetical protein
VNQNPLFIEDINDALRALVQGLGGPKAVGPMLFPDLGVEQAANRMRDCYNPERRERLSPEQLLFVLRKGREAGCHVLAHYLLGEAGYQDPVPLEPADEAAQLMRDFIETGKRMEALAARLDRTGDKVRPIVRVGAE